MNMNPNIILAGRQADFVNVLGRSNIAAAGANQIRDNNALRGLYQEQGPGIMNGDPGAMNALAQLDAPAAFDMNQQRQTNARADRQEGRLRAVSEGEITPLEGAAVMTLVEQYRRTLETTELEQRITALEAGN